MKKTVKDIYYLPTLLDIKIEFGIAHDHLLEEPTEEMIKEGEFFADLSEEDSEIQCLDEIAEQKREFIIKYLGEGYFEENITGRTWYNSDFGRIWIIQEKRYFNPQNEKMEIIFGEVSESGEKYDSCLYIEIQ